MEKIQLPPRFTRCLKCNTKIKYALPVHKPDGTRDFILECPNQECRFTYTVGEKIDETREREYQKQRTIMGGDTTTKMGLGT